MAGETKGALRGEHPDYPGWREFRVGEPEHFNRSFFGLTLVRLEAENSARVRIIPRTMHTNLYGSIHGGVVQALIDVSIFAGPTIIRGSDFSGAITLEINTHFVGGGDMEKPLDSVVEVVRETGKLLFCRGLVVQEDSTVASFSAILRKIEPK